MFESNNHITHDHQNPHYQCPVQMEILVIDSNSVSLRYIVAVLNKYSYRVTATTKVEECLDMLRKNQNKFNMVITNVVRPDMDGLKLLKIIIGLEMDIPVIMASADDKVENVMKAIKYGARDYLLKPISLLQVKNIWQHVVRKNLENGIKKRKIINYEEKEEEEEEVEVISISPQTSETAIPTVNFEEPKKSRIQWSNELHHKFVRAVQSLGVKDAIPTKILKVMQIPGLTRENVASHLQKYKNMLKKQKDEAMKGHQNTEMSIPRRFLPNVISYPPFNYWDTIISTDQAAGCSSYHPTLFQNVLQEPQMGNELLLHNTLSDFEFDNCLTENDEEIRIGNHIPQENQMTLNNEVENNGNDDDHELRSMIECLLDDGSTDVSISDIAFASP